MPTARDPVDVAARALASRDRSRGEIDARLARAGFDEAARVAALDELERLGYVDDERFAEARAASLAGRGYGDEAIRHDLAKRGILPQVAAAALASVPPEAERAQRLVDLLGPGRMTAAALVRKGFGAE